MTFVETDGSGGGDTAAIRSSQTGRYSVLPAIQPGGRLSPPSPPRLRYEPGTLLGRGGMAEVLSARDNDIGRTIALKRLRSDRQGQDALLRFIEEIRTVGRLEHPNIVPIHDVGVDEDGTWFFVMRYVPGEPLSAIIERLAAGDPATHAEYGVERRIRLFMEIAEAVAYAHQHGVLHRDIKPANIMIGAEGQVVVVDWGLARAEAAAAGGAVPHDGRALETQAGALIGTPLYMSPEQARGEPSTARSEVYALSVLLHELLFLRHYLDDRKDIASVLAGVPVVTPSFVSPPRQAPVPTEIAWILKDGLAKDPAARIPDVETLLSRLRRRAEGDIEVHCAVTAMHSVNRKMSKLLDRNPVLAGVLSCAGLGVVALGLVGWFV